MKLRHLVLGSFAVLALALTGCGSSTDDPDKNAAGATSSVPNPPVVRAANSGYGKDVRLECAGGLTPLRLGLGKHSGPETDYSLTEESRVKPEAYLPDAQVAVKLYAKPPAGTTIPTAIVHAADSPDQALQVNVGPNAVIDMRLLTQQYAYLPAYYQYYPITGVTLCLMRAN